MNGHLYTTPMGTMSGEVTEENIEQVAERIEELLTGKTYAWVAVNEYFGWKPEIRTGQKIEPDKATNGKAVYVNDGHCTVVDTYGAWGFSASTERYPVHVDISYTQGWQILIKHKAPGGNQLWWLVAVEEDTDKEGTQ